ncbi:MAG: tRNA-dihydrouridine synthase family protein [Bacteriovoracaceae bacterium]|nr:tRNA-dihydrouridine synthase family protein [Bacteriovoracaceae bacterium]
MNKERIELKELAEFPFCLAPMVGLSHVVLRDLIRQYIPAGMDTIWPTEMLNSRRIFAQPIGDTPETKKSPFDSNLVPQILVNEEKFLKESLPKLESWGACALDINMGCPQSKALSHNYGVSLMGDPSYAHEIVRKARQYTELPLSVKLRAGFNNDKEFLLKFCEGLYKAGANWLTLHPRTPKQKRRGDADWAQIKMIKDTFNLPLIGNGDVQTWEDALQMRQETNCDAVMIGRALCSRPWLLWQLAHKLGYPSPKGREGESPPFSPEEEALEYGKSVMFFIQSSFKYFEKKDAYKRINFYIRVSHPWLNFGHSLVSKMAKSKSCEEMLEECDNFFGKSQLLMSQKTELRY